MIDDIVEKHLVLKDTIDKLTDESFVRRPGNNDVMVQRKIRIRFLVFNIHEYVVSCFFC